MEALRRPSIRGAITAVAGSRPREEGVCTPEAGSGDCNSGNKASVCTVVGRLSVSVSGLCRESPGKWVTREWMGNTCGRLPQLRASARNPKLSGRLAGQTTNSRLFPRAALSISR